VTPDDLQLDRKMFLSGLPITLHRIAKTRYANLSGIGSAAFPGRWNLAGQEAIYTSTEIGTCVLERLAHTPKSLIPSNLSTMQIRISGQWQLTDVETSGSFLFDDRTAAAFYLCQTLRMANELFEDRFFSQRKVFAAAIPSVIAPAWNVVLYPLVNGFTDHVTLESVRPFEFDPRLFPEDTPIELP
jgi:RES domain-containing protein